ncbi:MAG TPA: hypothetical protein VLF93_01680 [Candidatus Saccharimonadales bacterium]|nr:hypothetical protein [Candidatus Saccharimonadales bacterium]
MSPDRKGIFVSGATGTRYSTRMYHDAMANASYRDVTIVPSALMSPEPPHDRELVGLLKESSGQPVDLYVHSSGGAQFRRALRQAGPIDMSNMTIVAIDLPKGPRNLWDGMKIVNGENTRAIDSITAFHPSSTTLSLASATEGLRQVFPDIKQSKSGLVVIDYQTGRQLDYSSSLTKERKGKMDEYDQQIADALIDGDLATAGDLYIQRGRLLRPDIESIYHGDNSLLSEADPARGEIKREGSFRSQRESARLLPGVIRGNGWRTMRELQQQQQEGNGPRVVVAIPEWGPYISTADAKALYSPQHEAGNSIFLSGLSHSGIAFQPQVIGEIKRYIDRTST